MAAEYTGEEAPSGIRRDALLREAERIVAGIAPPPETVTNEYEQAASDAELRVFEELVSQRSKVKSEEVDTISISYFEPGGDGFELVRATMAAYIPEKPETSGVVYYGSVPWR